MKQNPLPVHKWMLLCSFALMVVARPDSIQAATVQTDINFDSGSYTILNQSSVALSGGTTANGNGTVIQLGYYDGASAGNNFVGTWHALTGEGSLNTAFNTTSIGDFNASGAGDGTFAMNLSFSSAVAGTFNDLPSLATIPLAIRFYNGTTIAGSTNYNVVSDNLWLWKTPATGAPLPPTINMSLDDSGLVWLSGAGGAFSTSIAIAPEPSRIVFMLIGTCTLLLRRRRNGK